MSRRHLLAAVALLSASCFARADTISTFDLTGFDFQTLNTTATGQVTIDTTTGVVLSGNATFATEFLSFSLDHIQAFLATAGTSLEEIQFSDQGSLHILSLVLPVSSLIGYTGGPICSIAAPCPGFLNIGAEGFLGFASPDLETQGSLVLESATAATPEPSSLALLATGLFSAAGLARKRLLTR